MRSLLSLRAFGYNPKRVLPFKDGKYNILENKGLYKAGTASSTVLFGTTLYIGSRLLRFHSEMSWLSFLFQGSIFTLSGYLAKEYYRINSLLVSSIDLLENGEEIEVQTIGILGRKSSYMIKIEDIEDPEDNSSVKMYMNYLETWILKTNEEMLMIAPTSNMIDKEILHAILKGEKIEMNHTEEPIKDEDIIDI